MNMTKIVGALFVLCLWGPAWAADVRPGGATNLVKKGNEVLGEKDHKATPSPTPAQATNADDRIIEAVMDKLESSFKSGDYSYTLEVMYAPILQKMGGKEAVLEAAKALVEQMKQQQIVVVSWKARKPYQYVKGESRTYAIVPYESVVTVAGKRLRQSSYQLGIKTGDSNWQFVNGDNLNSEIYAEFFPDFPKSFDLPKLQRVSE